MAHYSPPETPQWATTKKRCPKCGSSTFTLTETFEELIIHDIVNGRSNERACEHQAGSPLGVAGSCKCGHTWKPRGCFQIDDILHDVEIITPGADNG